MERGLKELEKETVERKWAEERIEHLNAALLAILNVNKLITREKDRGVLLRGVCHSLIETRGYHNAWIALIDESGELATAVEAGLGNYFLPMFERLNRGELTECAQKTLRETGVIVVEDPYSTCSDCPLAEKYSGRGAMTKRLKYGRKVYGLLSTSIPGDLVTDEEEQALFEGVAGDIAFALHSIELEEERKRAEETLRKREVELEAQSHHLREANIALKVLMKQSENDKSDLEENVLSNVKQLVTPHLQRLKMSRLDTTQETLVNIVESNLDNIVSQFAGKLTSKSIGLTTTELRVADLVKEGRTNKEIAELLCLAENTIISHRFHIRSKLGLKNKKINLMSHLLSLAG
ncbi:MAG: hypothetical protein HWN69_03440 [Desulfobacterales bacterium]|nr:hypothetical protein [Desulfobacterales bacterium]